MIRVVVADEHSVVRLGVKVLLEHQADFTLVGETDCGPGLVEAAVAAAPDLVLVDVRLRDGDGVRAIRAIAGHPALPHTRVAVFTAAVPDELLFAALEAGATGVLLKDTEPEELVRSLRVIARGEAVLSPAVTRRVIRELTVRPLPPVAPMPWESLTGREHEVVALVTQGCSDSEIGDRLAVSPATVRTHVSRAMAKLKVHNRAQLVVSAVRSGLSTPRMN
ncbi:MAG: response regulator [Mycobacteriales bacterium]